MKYSYQVNPRIPVRGLKGHNAIIRPTVLDLERDEVIFCLRFGNVYRRFSQDNMVKVTRLTVNELHIPADKYKGEEKRHNPADTSIIGNLNVKMDEPTPVKETPIVGIVPKPANAAEGTIEEVPGLNIPEAKPTPVVPEPPVEDKKEEKVAAEEKKEAEYSVEEANVEESTEKEAKKEEAPVVSTPVDAAEETAKAPESISEENAIEVTDNNIETAVAEDSQEEEDAEPEKNDGGSIEVPGSQNNVYNKKKKKH